LSGFFFECIKTIVDEDSLVIVLHPPCGPDLMPSELWLFDYSKTSLACFAFHSANEFLEAVIEL
jgi:hypothetical protein